MVYRFRKSRTRRVLSLLMAAWIFFGSITPAYATSGTATTSSDVGSSFYSVSTALTAFANAALGPNGNDKHNDVVVPPGTDPDPGRSHKLYEFRTKNVGNGGCYVGYGDAGKGFVPFFQDNSTNAMTTSFYRAYQNTGDNGAGYGYVRYGRLLTDLGLSETGTAGADPARNMGGMFLQLVYLVSSFIPQLFEIAFKILTVLNPFRFLVANDATGGVATGTTGETIDVFLETPAGNQTGSVSTGDVSAPAIGDLTETNHTASGATVPDVLKPIFQYVTDIYVTLRGIGLWIVMPLLTAMLLFTVFVMGQSKAWGALQKYAVRFVFIVLGIPFLGITYTAVLDDFSEMSANQNRPSTRIVAGSVLDFQNWCTAWRLAPPGQSAGATETVNNVKLVSEGDSGTEESTKAQGNTSSDSWRTVRNTIYTINWSTGLYALKQDSGMGLTMTGTDTTYDESYGGMFNNKFSDDGVAGQQKIWVTLESIVETASGKNKNRNGLEGLIGRYQAGDQYSASAWASDVNSYLIKHYADEMGSKDPTQASTAVEKTVYQMYSDTDDMNDWLNRQQDENLQIMTGNLPSAAGGAGGAGGGTSTVTIPWADKDWNIFKNGGLMCTTEIPHDGNTGFVDGIPQLVYNDGFDNKVSEAEYGVNPKNVTGLSTISMYNYLCTEFDESGVRVYSSENSTSSYTKSDYYSAVMAGSGVTGAAFLLNCIVIMGIYVVLGVYYAVGMVISVLKHSFSMIMSIPAAMFGVMKSIVQVCAYVVQMITEILSSVWLYQVIMELVFVFATVAETPVKEALDKLAGSGVAGGVLAESSALALTLRLVECRPLFAVTIFLCTAVALYFSGWAVSAGRAVMSLFVFAHYKVMYAITMDEFKPLFADVLRSRESLDIWDDLKSDARGAAGAVGRAAGKLAGAARGEGMPV